MLTVRRIFHLFLPGHTNNHKAKVLHNSSLFLILIVFVIYQILFQFFPSIEPQVLGYAANISVEEVVKLTNERRKSMGLSALEVNRSLSEAALAKGTHMLEKDYWAHVAPDGTEPWNFFKSFNYKYKYAGENLARDFTNAGSAVEAWMNSPTHRENILSPKYKEIGIAVVEGDFGGVDTTIIVQFFGTRLSDAVAAPVSASEKTLIPTEVPLSGSSVSDAFGAKIINAEKSTEEKTLISPFNVTKNFSLVVVGLLFAVLVLDFILISRKNIARIGGRPFAHISFLGMVLAILLIAKVGRVL